MPNNALKDILLAFLSDHPDIELVQQATNQTVDLIASGVDFAIRGHTDALPDSSHIQRPLAAVSWQLFASSDYLMSKGKPDYPGDLEHHQCLKAGWLPATGQWTLENKQGVKTTFSFTPRLCSDDMSTLVQAAVNGLGIVSLPAYTCKTELARGNLVRVLPEWVAGKAQLSLLTPSRRSNSAAVRTLCDYLQENVKRHVGD